MKIEILMKKGEKMIKIEKLSNGIPVILEKSLNVKSVSIGIYVKTGAKNEEFYTDGISHFLEHMLFKGTKNRNAKQISEEIDFVGGHMNAYTSREVTAYYINILGEHIGNAIEILADMYINSEFPDEEIEKEKSVIAEEIKMYEDIPEEKVHDLNTEYVLKGTNFEKSILGTEESIKTITKEKLKEYWNDRYTTDNMVVSVVGDFDEKSILEKLEKEFQNLKKIKLEKNYKKDFCITSGKLEVKEEISQVHLCFNTKGLSYFSDDKYVLSVISNVLGGNMSSRLFQKIREDKGLAYSVYTYQSSYAEGGIFTAYAGTTKENYKEVIEIIKEEYKSIYKDGISEEELVKAKNQHLSSLILGLETTKARMSRMAGSYINYGEVKPIEKIMENIKKITCEDVCRCAKDLFNEENYSVIILGDV